MNKLIIVLIFFVIISPKVWGNENISSDKFLSLYQKDKITFGLNISSIEYTLARCEQNSLGQNNLNVMISSVHYPDCDNQYIEKRQNLFIGIQLSKKDKKNQFTVSFQSGFNFGIRNEYRDDGTQKIRVHANIKGDYDWGFMKGKYKGVFRFVSPGSTPYSDNSFNNNIILNEKYKLEGLIFNKDIYIGVEMSF